MQTSTIRWNCASGKVLNRRQPRDPGVVEGHVEPTEALDAGRDHRLDVGFVGDIGADRHRARPDRARRVIHAVGVAVGHRDLRALRAKSCAAASPIPDAAPVISATLPSSVAMVHSSQNPARQLVAQQATIARRFEPAAGHADAWERDLTRVRIALTRSVEFATIRPTPVYAP